MEANLTDALTCFIHDTQPDAIPALAFDKATMNVADTVGCILAGSNSEVLDPLGTYLRQSGIHGKHPVVGTAWRTSAAMSALANGTFGHALDFDDVLSMMPAHPSTVVLPAMFALLDQKASGRQFLDAYIIGVEAGAKIGLGIANGHYRRGFHATGTLAIFSAIAALARLLKLEPSVIKTAFGIGASMASGIRCNFGTMVKPFHAGWAAHNAVIAVDMARCGLTSNPQAFDARAGFIDAYGTEQSDMTRTIDTLGNPFVVATPGLALKKYPCIYLLHRPIDALVGLREKLQLNPENVDFIECRGAPGAFLPLINTLPASGLQSKFSMDYVLAVAAVDGKYNLDAFSDEAAARPILRQLYPRVRRVEDARCLGGDTQPQARSAGSLGFIEVTVRRHDGVQETVRVDQPRGAPERPLTWDDLAAKFSDCAHHAGLDQAHGRQTFDAWRQVGDAASVEPLVEMLAR